MGVIGYGSGRTGNYWGTRHCLGNGRKDGAEGSSSIFH